MIKNTLTTWCARGVLALISLSVAASAQATAIYDFTFTSTTTGNVIATGAFTTGAANPSVAGFDLITSMRMDTIVDSTNRVWGPFVSTSMPAEPSYNPTTQLFTNFDMTGTMPGLGDVIFGNAPAGIVLVLDTTSFIIGNHHFSAALTDRNVTPNLHVGVVSGANLVITAEPPAPVPEPTTLVLLGTGLLGAVVSRRRVRAS